MKFNLLKPIIDVFVDNGERYNMLHSGVLELLEYIRKVQFQVAALNFVFYLVATLKSGFYLATMNSTLCTGYLPTGKYKTSHSLCYRVFLGEG